MDNRKKVTKKHNIAERLRMQSKRVAKTGCRLIQKVPCCKQGYCQIRRNGRLVLAHRAAWELANGVGIPYGFEAHHTCGKPNCVQPAHIELLTKQEHIKVTVAERAAKKAAV